jgi:hypothetical protein
MPPVPDIAPVSVPDMPPPAVPIAPVPEVPLDPVPMEPFAPGVLPGGFTAGEVVVFESMDGVVVPDPLLPGAAELPAFWATTV